MNIGLKKLNNHLSSQIQLKLVERDYLINKIIQQINVKTQLLKEKQQKAKNSDNKYLVIVINQEKQHGNKDYQVRPPLPLQFALPKSEDKKDKEDVVDNIDDDNVDDNVVDVDADIVNVDDDNIDDNVVDVDADNVDDVVNDVKKQLKEKEGKDEEKEGKDEEKQPPQFVTNENNPKPLFQNDGVRIENEIVENGNKDNNTLKMFQNINDYIKNIIISNKLTDNDLMEKEKDMNKIIEEMKMLCKNKILI